MNKQKTFLVTGGAGFIGSHLVDKLLSGGMKVVCLDNFDDYYSPAIKRANVARHMCSNYQIMNGDIRDKLLLTGLFSRNNFDGVIHLAAKAGVRESIKDACEYYDVNVVGTVNLLEACAKHNVKKFVFASSSSVYGDTFCPSLNEDLGTDKPISPYAATKKAGEIACHAAHNAHGIDIACLRFFTVYGPRQKPGMAISKFTRLIMADENVPIYGPGDSSRGYTYIDDIVDGIISATRTALGFAILNLGGKDKINILDLVAMIEKAVGRKAHTKHLPKYPCDVLSSRADISKARALLQWSPTIGIEEGVKRFVTHMRQDSEEKGR